MVRNREKSEWYIFRLKQIIVTVRMHMSLSAELQYNESQSWSKANQNRKPKSIFSGHSSNHSLLFSYFSQYSPFSVLVSFLCFLCALSYFVFSTLDLCVQHVCKHFFQSIPTHACMRVFTFSTRILFFMLFSSFATISIFPDYCHYPWIWRTFEHSVVIIQVPKLAHICPFEIHFNVFFRYRIFFPCTETDLSRPSLFHADFNVIISHLNSNRTQCTIKSTSIRRTIWSRNNSFMKTLLFIFKLQLRVIFFQNPHQSVLNRIFSQIQ